MHPDSQYKVVVTLYGLNISMNLKSQKRTPYTKVSNVYWVRPSLDLYTTDAVASDDS
jgi:hypothetical protein